MNSASKQHRLSQLEHACRERGLPVTVQRRTVLEMILDREDHPTADQVYDQVRRRLPAISRATVYRILDTLVEFGLIMKICHPGTAARFDPKIHQHHHLVCTHCEAIIDVEEGRFDKITWPDVRRYGFEIRDYHIHFRGICQKCRRKLNAGETTAHRTRKPGAGGVARAGSEHTLRQRRPRQ
jgi:Fur family transcriptional regulator, peroxide stress response regulator